jgi:D-beta-D-heptose 7-phosphate kinase/D-beta-D-heptose 1-phosphate adenosyltransferase
MMTNSYDPKTLCAGIDRFPSCRILVVGDLIMDQYIWGKVERISPEAPVPVVQATTESHMLGGAGNVGNNIVSLGGRVALCGVIGSDPMGSELTRMVGETESPIRGIVVEKERPTTIKTRVVAHSQQVVRVDREELRAIDHESIEKILAFVGEEIGSIDAILIADYGKGVITTSLMDGVKIFAKANRIVVAADPHVKNTELYGGITFITPNKSEAQMMSGISIEDEDSLRRAGEHLLIKLGCQMVLITRGEEGMTLFQNSGDITKIPTVARKVFDVSGAGDTVIGTFTLALAAGLRPTAAAVLANFAAGIVVAEVGTATVSGSQLKQAVLSGLP